MEHSSEPPIKRCRTTSASRRPPTRRMHSAPVFPVALLLLWLCVLLVSSPAAHADKPDRPLPADEATITEETVPGRGVAVKAVFFIDANPDAVYATLKDASRFPEFMPDTKDATIVDSGEGYHVAVFIGGTGLLEARFVMKRVFVDNERSISWTQVEGRTLALQGSWLVREEGGGSVITYRNCVDAGALIPDALVKAHLRESVPPLVASLRMRVQSVGSWKSEA